MGPLRLPYSVKQLLQSILTGLYTARELRTFLELCHALALPVIRKRLYSGKLNLPSLGITERELVYDCLAELFERGEDGRTFVRLRQYLTEQNPLRPEDSDEAALVRLQQIVFMRAHHGLVRIHAELDPVLERILRSVKRTVDQYGVLTIIHRLGEDTLVVADEDGLWNRPPMPTDVLREEMSRVVHAADSIRAMTEKLYGILRAQSEYQRAMGLLNSALIFKELTQSSWGAEREFEQALSEPVISQDIGSIIHQVCNEVQEQMYRTYVSKGKRTEAELAAYMHTLNTALAEEFVAGSGSTPVFYEELQRHLGRHSQHEYRRRHRKVLEYLSRIARKKLFERLRSEHSADR